MIADIFRLLSGWGVYAAKRQTPAKAYRSMIKLHCRTSGYSNDLLHAMVAKLRPNYCFPSSDGVLGDLSSDDVNRISGGLREMGYYVFPQRLPPDMCDRLLEYAQRAPAKPTPQDESLPSLAVYERENPIAPAYKFDEQTLLDNRDIQSLISDWSILSVAQAYLKCRPVLSIVAMWWSTLFGGSEESRQQLAQMYHFDMDRIKWLKFFVHLTDVTSETGPHCFIAKSHRRGNQPRDLLRRGYSRIPDADIKAFYSKEDFVEVTGPRGTIFAADTRGFHKGKPIQMDDRLILQLEFCNSLFGGSYRQPTWPPDCDSRLNEVAGNYRRVYERYRRAA